MNKKITIINHSNGLRVSSDEMKEVDTVSVGVFVNTGSRNENKLNNGISHFLEHLAFKGTKKRTAKQIAEQFEAIGGRINAYTSREKTVYYAKILKKDSEFAIEFLADIIQNSIFDGAELEKERGVILQEIAMTNDTPDDIIFDYFQETAFPKQSIGLSILGPKGNIKKFNSENFINYVKKQYNYSNIAISASGAIDNKTLDSLTNKYFKNLSSNKITKFEPAKYQGGDFRKNKKLEQNNILIGFEGLSYNHPQYYATQMLAMILGGGMSSRLFQEVREKLGLAYSIYAFNQSYQDCGIFGIYAGTTPENTNKLIETTIEEIKKICEKITDAEIKKVSNQFEAGLLMAKESTSSRMQRLGNDIINFNRIISDEEIIEQIKNITKKDLIKIAHKIFYQSKPTFTAIGKIANVIDYSNFCQKLQ